MTAVATDNNRSYYWIVPVVFLVALVAFYRLSYPLLNDNDVPWHIATGKLLLQMRHLPKTDPFAYGNQNQPWYLLSWLWDLMLGAVNDAFGPLGDFIFTITIGAGLTAGLCFCLLKRGIALPAVMLTSALAGLSLLDYITARPQLVGYALAFVFHALMHESRRDSGYRHLAWLPFLMLVWTNAHGSFLAGFIIMGAYAAEAWFTKKTNWLKRIVITGVACLVCAMINPYGPEVVIGTLTTLNGSSTRYNTEWQPFSFATSTGLSLWLLAVIVASNIRSTGVAIADKLLAMAWLLATMVSIRNGAFFILTSAPYLATCIDEQTRDLRKSQPETPLAIFMKQQPLKRVWLAAIGLYAVMCLVASVLPHEEQIESEDFSIRDAIDYAQSHYPDHHFYTDYSFGGQVIYHTQGKLPFFMDSRAGTAYSDADIRKYLDFLRMTPGWEETLKERHLNGIIIGKSTNFAGSFDKGLYHDHWKLVFEGKRVNVYIARP